MTTNRAVTSHAVISRAEESIAEPPSVDASAEETLIIDCDRCSVRGLACGDCVVSVLLGPPAELDRDSRTALAVLAGSGLVPPLRLVTSCDGARQGGGVNEVA